MEKSYSMSNFIELLCATYKCIGFEKISFSDIEMILRLVQYVPEFENLKEKFLSDVEYSLEEYISICSKYGEVEGQELVIKEDFDYDEVLEKYSGWVNSMSDAIFSTGMINELSDYFDFSLHFHYESPNKEYQLGYQDSGFNKQENILFTDGNIVKDSVSFQKINGNYFDIRNVTIADSTYSIICAIVDNSTTMVNLRSDVVSDGFVVREVASILSDRIDHYKKVGNDNPKVYKLIKQ